MSLRRRKRTTRIAIEFAGLLALAGCVTDKVTGERRFAITTWTNAEEQQIGDQAAPNFEQQYGGSLPDADTQRYLGGLVLEMTGKSVRRDDFAWQFEILNSSEPNAFALPGGYVYITRGLLENMESEGEFVAVLGHELGHVEHQHSMLQQNKAIAATVLVGLIGAGEQLLQKDPDQPAYVTALASAAAPLVLLSFSRDQESEADERGVFFANAMGYDPREMKKTFEYFDRLEKQSGSSTPSFLRSHPTNERRLTDIDATIERVCPEVLAKPAAQFRAPPRPDDRFVRIVAGLGKQAPAWRKHDEAVALLMKADGDAAKLAQAHKLAEEARAAAPDEPLFECLLGEVEYTQGAGDRGRARFEHARTMQQKQTATSAPASAGGAAGSRRAPKSTEYWKPAFYLGALDVEAGHGPSAATNLRRASALFPDNPTVAYYLGRAEELNHDPVAATQAYERVTQLAPADSPLAKKSTERLEVLHPKAAPKPATKKG